MKVPHTKTLWRVEWWLGDNNFQTAHYDDSEESRAWIKGWQAEAERNLHPELKLVVYRLNGVLSAIHSPSNPLTLKEITG